MEGAASTTRTRTVPSAPDGAGTVSWHPASDNDAAAALCKALGLELDDLRDGRRRWRINNRLNYYRALARRWWANGDREIRTTREALARQLYDDVDSLVAMKRKHSALRRVEADLVAAGLIEIVEQRSGRGGGLTVRLLHPGFERRESCRYPE